MRKKGPVLVKVVRAESHSMVVISACPDGLAG